MGVEGIDANEVGSEAMSQMVRNGQIRENRGGHKMLISLELLVRLTSNLDKMYMRVCPTTRWHCFCTNDVTGVSRGTKMALEFRGCIFLPKTQKTRKDTTWSV